MTTPKITDIKYIATIDPKDYDLNPCPKCGSTMIVVDHYSAMCTKCQFNGPELTNAEIRAFGGYNNKCVLDAVRRWNAISNNRTDKESR